MIVVKEGRVWLKVENSKVAFLKLKNFKFKECWIKLWRQSTSETNLHMDIMNINSAHRVIKDFMIIDRVSSIQRVDNRKFCLRLNLPRSCRIFLSTMNETELHEWLSVILSLYQPPLTPAVANVHSVFVISSDNNQVIPANTATNLWLCLELEELKFYQCHDLRFLLAIPITDLLSVDMVTDCQAADVDKILKISFAITENHSTSNVSLVVDNNKRLKSSVYTLILFSFNAKTIYQSLRFIKFGEMKFEKSPKTKVFKKPNSLALGGWKSLENLSKKNFFARSLNCLSVDHCSETESPPDSPSPTGSISSTHSQTSSSLSPSKAHPPPLPSKEELEKRENAKLMEKDIGRYKTLQHAASKSVDNLKILTTHHNESRALRTPPTLPPRKLVEIAKVTPTDDDQNWYKTLSSQDTTPVALYKTLGHLEPLDRGNMRLDLDHSKNHTNNDNGYKILSPMVTPVKCRKFIQDHHNGHVEENRYNVLHNSTPRSCPPKTFVRISTETEV